MGKVELKIDVDADLLEQAQAAGVSIAATLEEALRDAITDLNLEKADDRARQWAIDNAEAIEAYNRRIAGRGLFGDEHRKW